MKWTDDEENRLIELRNKGVSLPTIAELLNRPYVSVSSKSSRLIKCGKLESWKPREEASGPRVNWPHLSEEELLDQVRIYVSRESAPYYIRTRVKHYFGSWTNALEAAGISGNIGGKFTQDRITRVYLLKFGTFYKVGVTQQQIKSRFSGAPRYEILDFVATDLDNATYLEKELKKSIAQFQFIPLDPWFERNGKTECFIPPHPINALEEIFEL